MYLRRRRWSRPNIRVAAPTRLHGVSASRPRRRRDSSEEYPRRGRGVAAIHRRRGDSSEEYPRRGCGVAAIHRRRIRAENVQETGAATAAGATRTRTPAASGSAAWSRATAPTIPPKSSAGTSQTICSSTSTMTGIVEGTLASVVTGDQSVPQTTPAWSPLRATASNGAAPNASGVAWLHLWAKPWRSTSFERTTPAVRRRKKGLRLFKVQFPLGRCTRAPAPRRRATPRRRRRTERFRPRRRRPAFDPTVPTATGLPPTRSRAPSARSRRRRGGRGVAATGPRTIRVAAVAVTRTIHGAAAAVTRTIHVAAAASPRSRSTEYPRGSRGGVATTRRPHRSRRSPRRRGGVAATRIAPGPRTVSAATRASPRRNFRAALARWPGPPGSPRGGRGSRTRPAPTARGRRSTAPRASRGGRRRRPRVSRPRRRRRTGPPRWMARACRAAAASLPSEPPRSRPLTRGPGTPRAGRACDEGRSR